MNTKEVVKDESSEEFIDVDEDELFEGLSSSKDS